MNLKTNGIILLLGCLLGGFGAFKLIPQPAPVAPVAIPESEELSKLKKQLAEYSSQKKSLIKEYNCANGALSKETSIDEATAAKIAVEAEEKAKKVKELVVAAVEPRDNFMLDANSKLQFGFKVSPLNHYWLGYKRDFQSNENIYETSYSTRIF